MTLNEFIHMGGYGFYVWSSYAITLLVLIINIILPARHKTRLLADIARKLRRARSTT
jgi:heme exporter protein D